MLILMRHVLRALRAPHALLSVLVAGGALASSCSREMVTAPVPGRTVVGVNRVEQGGTEDEVVVTLAPGADAAQVGADYGATLVESEAWGCAAYLPAPGETPLQLAARMAGDPRILTAEGNAYLEPAESRQRSWAFDDGHGSVQTYTGQAATLALNLEGAHRVTRGEGVRVAILDTGAELTHRALADRVVAGKDFIGNDYDPTDAGDGVDHDGDGFVDEAQGHGTHVAGIVALTAPAAKLLIVRVLDADGRGDVLDIAAGIYWAVDQGARVINLSLGTLKSSDAIQYALEQAENAGVVIVAAAGNWGSETPKEYPARSSHALGVAALGAGDCAAPFTSFGDFVALSAPGVAVRSAYLNGGYALWSGTSMAAPFVAGSAALLLAVHPGWNQDQVMARLAATARPVDPVNPGKEGKLGAGALDTGASLLPDLAELPPPPDVTDLLGGPRRRAR